MDETEAARSLEAMGAMRGRLAERTRWSLGRHGAVGLLLGTLIAGYALPGFWPVVVVAACLAATAAIVARDRRRDGFFVSGYRRGPTLWVTGGVMLLAFGAFAAAIVLKGRYGLDWAPAPIGLAVALAGTLGSIAWERVFLRELRDARRGR